MHMMEEIHIYNGIYIFIYNERKDINKERYKRLFFRVAKAQNKMKFTLMLKKY